MAAVGSELNRLVAGLVRSARDGLASITVAAGRMGLSFELAHARELAPLPAEPDGLSVAERYVFRWLARHRVLIENAESRWDVDRRAVAAAIVWEALENPNYFTPLVRGVGRVSGPGKVHYRSKIIFGEGNPVAKQVELDGYLPRRTRAERRKLLRGCESAIDYIGAIMSAYADIGSSHGFDLRYRDDLILTQPYNGVRLIGGLDELDSWRAALARHRRRGTLLKPLNPMYKWANRPDNRAFLEAAVGYPRGASAGDVPSPACPIGTGLRSAPQRLPTRNSERMTVGRSPGVEHRCGR